MWNFTTLCTNPFTNEDHVTKICVCVWGNDAYMIDNIMMIAIHVLVGVHGCIYSSHREQTHVHVYYVTFERGNPLPYSTCNV